MSIQWKRAIGRIKIFNDAKTKEPYVYEKEAITKHMSKIPMTKGNGSATDGFAALDERFFQFRRSSFEEENAILHYCTKEIADYRLHAYFERKETGRK